MTEEILKRANAFAGHQAKKHFPMSFHESERKTAAFIGRIAYLRGMQDPDAGKDSLAVVNLIHADEKIRELQVAYKGLLEENMKLRELLKLAIQHSKEYSEGCFYCDEDQEYVAGHGETSEEHKKTCWFYRSEKALSSGGE